MSKLLIDRLITEFSIQDKSGIYGFTQYTMAYNSNKIEGSALSEKHTAFLFETMSLYGDNEEFRAKDVEEAQGHFLMFNHSLSTLDNDLTEELICQFHYKLKSGVFEDRANGYAIGSYKERPNIIAGKFTVLPKDVPIEMKKLLEWYNNSDKSIETMVKFHSKFENIHPFQDGNGRVGRMILFRECLKNEIIPIVIRDKNKVKYYKGLSDAEVGDYKVLVSLFKEEQSWYEDKVKLFLGM